MSFFKNIFSRQPAKPAVITVVSGLPRSGTSMMMKMLEAGGIPPLTDQIRAADADNPKGYYEFERVKRLDKGDTAWVAQAAGHCVKVISALLQFLPAAYEYQVVFVRRDMAEILASQRKMLANRGENSANMDDDKMAALFAQHLQQVETWLASQANMRVLYCHYRDILARPEAEAQRINAFLGGQLDVAAMATAVDPNLYRNRQAAS